MSRTSFVLFVIVATIAIAIGALCEWFGYTHNNAILVIYGIVTHLLMGAAIEASRNYGNYFR